MFTVCVSIRQEHAIKLARLFPCFEVYFCVAIRKFLDRDNPGSFTIKLLDIFCENFISFR